MEQFSLCGIAQREPYHFLFRPLSQKLTPILKAQQARHQEDNCGHNHQDAVLEQDNAPDGGVDVLRLIIRIDGNIPYLILNKRQV